MRRVFLFAALGLLVAAVLVAAGFCGIATAGPLRPGARLFAAQDAAEQMLAGLQPGAAGKAERYVELARRRMIDLQDASGSPREAAAMAYVNAALDRVVIALAQVPDGQAQEWRGHLAVLEERLRASLDGLSATPHQNAAAVRALTLKLASLSILNAEGSLPLAHYARLAAIDTYFTDPGLERIASGGSAAAAYDGPAHMAAALAGRHAVAECSACHVSAPGSQVAAVAVRQCATCHAERRPAGHPEGACSVCHNELDWSQGRFDHRIRGQIMDCQACHLQDRPAYHTLSNCASCHNSGTWGSFGAAHQEKSGLDCRYCHPSDVAAGAPVPGVSGTAVLPAAGNARFEHPADANLDCRSCHAAAAPGMHSPGQCSQCHLPGVSWRNLVQDHPGGTASDCRSCHAALQPANHFPGQCSQCHATGAGWQGVRFSHVGVALACDSCHASQKPATHYTGQCSACHAPGNTWQPVRFNHQVAGATDCQGCHAALRPADHYQGQCSSCHTTIAWRPASFNHQAAAAVDCQGCHAAQRPANHYQAQCSSCHSTTAWRPASFDHLAAAATDCQACHEPQRPANHYQAQCSSCHSTTAWRPASFNHQAAGATDCQACHEPQRPANHFQGQCSSCHSTTAWMPATFSHQTPGLDCQGCHEAQRPAGHLQGQCSDCHNAGTSWRPATIAHTFPIGHRGADTCARCHPSASPDWTCYTCHNQVELEREHLDEGISPITGLCMNCHPTGEESANLSWRSAWLRATPATFWAAPSGRSR